MAPAFVAARVLEFSQGLEQALSLFQRASSSGSTHSTVTCWAAISSSIWVTGCFGLDTLVGVDGQIMKAT